MNASRPIAWRLVPSDSSCFSTWRCVAIPAWSVPKIHFARCPRMRARRMQRSWIAALSAWPMCSEPVTFGGGTAIEKFSLASPAGSGWNIWASRQRANTRDSTSPGS